ncbi:MAG: ARP2/3 complex subunit ARPC4 [Amphiamblys sp. WSBS2006]|nr:MAG: ARP2/3 complex subunit ARPC4 [Amphiamblys sp. WSBS2006]
MQPATMHSLGAILEKSFSFDKTVLCTTPLVETEPGNTLPAPASYSLPSSHRVLVESSPNSSRVSVFFQLQDTLDSFVCKRLCAAIMRNAVSIGVVRRVPISGYHLSFLITQQHTSANSPEKYCALIVSFIAHVCKTVSETKLDANASSREFSALLFSSLRL